MIKSVAVYLGSSTGNGRKFMDFARDFGVSMAKRGIAVIYGGADVGTMSALADGVLSVGGHITGVFPDGFGGKREVQAMNIEIQRKDLSETIIVKDFAERKAVMEQLSDCAVALPGSIGTMDELFCYSVNNEIGLHSKPAFVLNLDHYYDGFKLQLETIKSSGFLPKDSEIIKVCDSAEEFFEQLSC